MRQGAKWYSNANPNNVEGQLRTPWTDATQVTRDPGGGGGGVPPGP